MCRNENAPISGAMMYWSLILVRPVLHYQRESLPLDQKKNGAPQDAVFRCLQTVTV